MYSAARYLMAVSVAGCAANSTTDPTAVAQSQYRIIDISATVTPDGRTHLAYVEKSNAHSALIYTSKSLSGAWSPPRDLGKSARRPSIVADAKGGVHLVYESNGGAGQTPGVIYRKLESSWSELVDISETTGGGNTPTITVFGNSVSALYIAQNDLVRTDLSSSGWTPPLLVGTESFADARPHAHRDIVVWATSKTPDTKDIAIASLTGDASDSLIVATGWLDDAPVAALGPDGSIHVAAWATDGRWEPKSTVMYRVRTGGSWGVIDTVSANVDWPGDPTIVVDGDGTVHLAYQAGDIPEIALDPASHVWYSRKDRGSNWTTPCAMTPPGKQSFEPQLVKNSDSSVSLYFVAHQGRSWTLEETPIKRGELPCLTIE